MIPRQLKHELLRQLAEYPVVTLLGPRQAGKTTLVRHTLPHYEYVNLELPDIRAFAKEDPRAFLKQHSGKVIFDEIQRAPDLLSYIQAIVDTHEGNGQFILTGSHQLQLRASISQSLAGRTGILHLLPLSISELGAADIQFDAFHDYIYHGFLPRIHDQKQRPHVAYANYYQTYIERDVRQLINLKEVSLFEKFMKLLAGRSAQLANYQSLASDVGVDAKTIKQWLSILEASYVIFKLPPYYKNFGKRAIKSPKYYFSDTGLLAYLLDIETSQQLVRDPLIGNMFENLIVLEAYKTRYNQGRTPNLYFFRDSQGKELDLLYKKDGQLCAAEIKSASTWNNSFKKQLLRFAKTNQPLAKSAVIYSGENRVFSDDIRAINFKSVQEIF